MLPSELLALPPRVLVLEGGANTLPIQVPKAAKWPTLPATVSQPWSLGGMKALSISQTSFIYGRYFKHSLGFMGHHFKEMRRWLQTLSVPTGLESLLILWMLGLYSLSLALQSLTLSPSAFSIGLGSHDLLVWESVCVCVCLTQEPKFGEE